MIMLMLSDLIKENNLYEKFPESFGTANLQVRGINKVAVVQDMFNG